LNTIHNLIDPGRLTWQLGSYQAQVDDAFRYSIDQRVVQRLWEHDHTLWKAEPTEIINRLGWLHSIEAMQKEIPALTSFTEEVREAGFRQALLLGMGGSSLAPDLFGKVFSKPGSSLNLSVLDSTNPDAVYDIVQHLGDELLATLLIVSTKSGTTVETLSLFKFFYNRLRVDFDQPNPGKQFIAITDPNSQLEKLAKDYQFRATFINDPNIGGRYSALSFFGLVPAVLCGTDIKKILERAQAMAANNYYTDTLQAPSNLALRLGAIVGSLARSGLDKLTLVTSPQLSSFGVWIEQLIAESTGKEGRGILPVVDEKIRQPETYPNDRLFVQIYLENEPSVDNWLKALEDAGHPVVRMHLQDFYDLGAQFFLWEMATAISGHILSINPFDQPDVEAAKVLARQMVDKYQQSGELTDQVPSLKSGQISVYGGIEGHSLADVFTSLLSSLRKSSYLAIQAYLPENRETDDLLQKLRDTLGKSTRRATTLGYGPRFLHSTGQLHKGDGGKGLFVQITASPIHDLTIPDQPDAPATHLSFGTLIRSQALGDAQALQNSGRKVIRFHIYGEVVTGLEAMLQTLEQS
jgi:transaldolase/glucose-6-phosphate isomerase